MTPGRFFSLWFLSLGALLLVGFLSGVATGQIRFQSIVYTLALGLPGIGTLVYGLSRLRDQEREERPAEYGPWTYLATLVLVGMTGWFLYAGLFATT